LGHAFLKIGPTFFFLAASRYFYLLKTYRMDEEFVYRRIQKALENLPENFNVLEEQINLELQVEYFDFSHKMKTEEYRRYLKESDQLFETQTAPEEKKKILSALASSGEVEAFRTIEKYLKNPDSELKDWAVLALQESRMLLQSSLLDEQQVFISTGLGGKGQKLRYFVVFLNNSGELTDMQKKLLGDELAYVMKQNDGEVEELNTMLDFTTAVVILPIKAPLKDIFKSIIDECNQYGNFLQEDMVITNVKRLNPVEIVELLNQQRNQQTDEEEQPD